jgi:hypothetical protein
MSRTASGLAASSERTSVFDPAPAVMLTAPPRRENGRRLRLRSYIGIGIAVAVAVGVIYLFGSRPGRVLDVGGSQLGTSLSRESGGTGGGCTRQSGRSWWWCGVETDPGSGFGATYRLTTDSSGCWDAQESRVKAVPKAPSSDRVGRPQPVPSSQPLSGCVTIFDFIFPDHAGV